MSKGQEPRVLVGDEGEVGCRPSLKSPSLHRFVLFSALSFRSSCFPDIVGHFQHPREGPRSGAI